ncbi:hypothetical protein M0R45_004581 [Rubus argutus]|uniref:Protein kinase domain-containing protein n=1 Tax=Rubus argutus TaxID=59490 RepID=A0AAW1YK99_RUBAR
MSSLKYCTTSLPKTTVLLLLLLSALVQCSSGLDTDGLLLLSFKLSILQDPQRVLESWSPNDETPCSWRGVTCATILTPPENIYCPRVIGLALPNSQLLELRFLDLAFNRIPGVLPETVSQLSNLQVLNLSENALAGKIPSNLASLRNLTAISLKSNYFSGEIPSGFEAVEVLDLSLNLINGSLPSDFGGDSLRYFNVSRNGLSGEIPATLPRKFLIMLPLISLSTTSLAKSRNLGRLCSQFSSSFCCNSQNAEFEQPRRNVARIEKWAFTKSQTGLKPATIAGIVAGDVAGIAVIAMVFLYIQMRKKKKDKVANVDVTTLKKEPTHRAERSGSKGHGSKRQTEPEQQSKGGTLVTVDGEKELELETLLKASAYILGATGSSIMYKAVLEDGSSLAVRRIGEQSVDRFKDFENQIRLVAKLAHPNLVRIRGFYWGIDEKLIIYDFVPNGSLANARYRKVGSSPCHLPWEARLRIAKGKALQVLEKFPCSSSSSYYYGH